MTSVLSLLFLCTCYVSTTSATTTTSASVATFIDDGQTLCITTKDEFQFALDQYDAATVIWDGSNWYVVGQYGATIA